MAVDDNNSAKIIYKANPGGKLDHKNATVGWVYKKDDIELEPRFNLGAPPLLCFGGPPALSFTRHSCWYSAPEL